MPKRNRGQFTKGSKAGIATRFGPDWPGRRCGARCKRTGRPCQQPAMPNHRCRLHGGKSTGPRTPEGLARLRRANTTHGLYAGPNHPDFGELPGPYWRDDELREIYRRGKISMRILKKAGLL